MLSSNSHPAKSAFHRLRAALLASTLGVVAVAAAPMFVLAEPTSPPPVAAGGPQLPLPSFAPLVQKVMPAVVNISVKEKAESVDGQDQATPGEQPFPNGAPSPFDQFRRKFFNQPFPMPPQAERMALGSGFIIDPEGYIVTNNHVVDHAAQVTAIFEDGSRHAAKVVGRDPKTDLALLKVEVDHPLPYVAWGDSDASHVGDWVMAVGNPFGLGGTVSTGIISARGRDIQSGPYDDFLQIDAAINRGNSGGPTFDLNGEVIGINTAIYSPNGGSVGIAFAIPSSLAKPIIEQLKEHGKVERGWLGVDAEKVTPEIAHSLGLAKVEGAIVSDVVHDGPAAKAGVEQGDVILSFNGHDIKTLTELPISVAETPAGDHARLKVWRNGRDETLDVTVGKMPEHPALAEGGATALGVTFAPLTAKQRQRLGVADNVKGAVVAEVAKDSPLADLGIERGDVVEAINQQPVATPDEAVAALDKARKEESGKNTNFLFLLNRHGVNQYVALTVENGAEKG